mgnify:CR=1 FL=1
MINENIKHFRKEKGLNQEELAVKLHVVRQTVSKWENGLSVPDADVLIRLADVLDVSVSQLLGILPAYGRHPTGCEYSACGESDQGLCACRRRKRDAASGGL